MKAVFWLVIPVALLVIAVYVQVLNERSRLRRAALDRPAKFAGSARERHAQAQAAYQLNMTLANYHALRAAEDTLEHGSQELHQESA